MEQKFIESVKKGDVKDVRLSLSNELLWIHEANLSQKC